MQTKSVPSTEFHETILEICCDVNVCGIWMSPMLTGLNETKVISVVRAIRTKLPTRVTDWSHLEAEHLALRYWWMYTNLHPCIWTMIPDKFNPMHPCKHAIMPMCTRHMHACSCPCSLASRFPSSCSHRALWPKYICLFNQIVLPCLLVHVISPPKMHAHHLPLVSPTIFCKLWPPRAPLYVHLTAN